MVFKYDQYGPAALHISSSSHITGHRLTDPYVHVEPTIHETDNFALTLSFTSQSLWGQDDPKVWDTVRVLTTARRVST